MSIAVILYNKIGFSFCAIVEGFADPNSHNFLTACMDIRTISNRQESSLIYQSIHETGTYNTALILYCHVLHYQYTCTVTSYLCRD